jgi:hypothetical protein
MEIYKEFHFGGYADKFFEKLCELNGMHLQSVDSYTNANAVSNIVETILPAIENGFYFITTFSIWKTKGANDREGRILFYGGTTALNPAQTVFMDLEGATFPTVPQAINNVICKYCDYTIPVVGTTGAFYYTVTAARVFYGQ